jgi:peptidoglycan/xylan/chitin deacetylase (PgdA/CDA1 family)
VDRFEEQLESLMERFTVVPLTELLDAVQAGGQRLAAITFDDGFEDLYTCAFPALRRLKLPFTAFLTTGYLEGGRDVFGWSPHYANLCPLTWQQVREMASAGCSVGSHTHSHPRLSDCAIAQVKQELTRSKWILEDRLGVEVTALAYPFGQPHDYDRRVMSIASKVGYSYALTGLQSCLTSIGNRYEVPRVMIDARDDREDFAQKITGRRDFVAPLERFNSVLIRNGLRRKPVSAPRSTAGTFAPGM